MSIYRQAGKGPDVVLLRDTADHDVSLSLFEHLACHFRVTMYGSRTVDASPKAWNSTDIADELHSFHQALGLGPCFLLAHHAACVAALHAAVLYPDMVAGLLLHEPRLSENSGSLPRNGRPGLTARRIVLIDRPVIALCGRHSATLPLGRFFEENLAQCKLVIVPDDESKLVTLIQEQLREMVGLSGGDHDAKPPTACQPPTRSRWSSMWPDCGNGRAIARWMIRVSAWGL
jgi:hypothetical protein